MAGEWRHRMDLAAFQATRASEWRVSLVENDHGPAVMIRAHHASRHHSGMNADPSPLIVFPNHVPALIAALEKGAKAAAALRSAR